MTIESKIFEEAGLKIEKDRVLTYSELICPLNCKYCFAGDLNFNHKKDVAYLSERQLELMKRLPNEINLIMLGCDTEFLQHKARAIQILENLSNLGCDISVVTKLSISSNYLEKLSEIADKIKAKGNLFSLSISVPCTYSSPKWETGVPSPEKRIKTLE